MPALARNATIVVGRAISVSNEEVQSKRLPGGETPLTAA